MEIEEMQKMLESQTKLLAEMQKQLGKKTPKKSGKKQKPEKQTGKKLPEISSKEIPNLIKKMSKTELKTLFGLDIGKNKDCPYKAGVKEFIHKYNLVSGNAYPVYLKYENKHLIIEKLYGKNAKKICIDYLKAKLPDAKNDFVKKALENEIGRWG